MSRAAGRRETPDAGPSRRYRLRDPQHREPSRDGPEGGADASRRWPSGWKRGSRTGTSFRTCPPAPSRRGSRSCRDATTSAPTASSPWFGAGGEPPGRDILSEVRSLAARNVVEVVLLGQNVNSYGKKEGEIPFPELLRRISRVEGISRVRFITSHPRDLDDRTIRLFEEIVTLCPHVHLPLQSGSDRVLASMGRAIRAVSTSRRSKRCGASAPAWRSPPTSSSASRGKRRTIFVRPSPSWKRSGSTPRSRSGSLPPRDPGAEMKEKVDPKDAAARLLRLQHLQATHTRERLSAQVDGRSPFLSKERARGIGGCVCGRTACNKTVNFTSRARRRTDAFRAP